jgi:hypothetical protein
MYLCIYYIHTLESAHPALWLYVCTYIYLSIYLSIHLPIHLSIHPSIQGNIMPKKKNILIYVTTWTNHENIMLFIQGGLIQVDAHQVPEVLL